MKRSLKVGAAATVALTVVGGGVAFAYWTGTASATANATTDNPTGDVTVVVNVTGDPMSPAGPTQTIEWTATNGSTNTITLTRVDYAITALDADGNLTVVDPTALDTSCTINDYQLIDSTGYSHYYGSFSESIVSDTGSAVVLASGDTVTRSAKIQMIDTYQNQNACKGVTVPIKVTVG